MQESLEGLGEFGFISRIRARLSQGPGVVLGPGDDAALLRLDPRMLALFTVDAMVEGVHFDLALSSAADVGWKLLVASVSDAAAMGGRPLFAVASVGAPAGTDLAVAEGFLEGLAEAAETYGVSVVGGDVVRAPVLTASLSLIGEVAEDAVLRRSGARTGDALVVVGGLGAAAAGLELLRSATSGGEGARRLLAEEASLASAHRRPRGLVSEGGRLAGLGVRCAIDVSDGLAADAGHICEESGVGVVVEASRVPLAAGVERAGALLHTDPLRLALAGGEDFALAAAVPQGLVEQVVEAFESEALAPIAVCGRFTLPGQGRWLALPDGSRRPLEGGWDHFASGSGRP
ncbi:MAG: thiamine-phosphate kinase [Actinomycetota bacterium]